jgi:hypothetical protein
LKNYYGLEATFYVGFAQWESKYKLKTHVGLAAVLASESFINDCLDNGLIFDNVITENSLYIAGFFAGLKATKADNDSAAEVSKQMNKLAVSNLGFTSADFNLNPQDILRKR